MNNINDELQRYLDTLKSTNYSLSTIVDWEGVIDKVFNIKVSLHTANCLLGCKTDEEMKALIQEMIKLDENIFCKVLPTLIARRKKDSKYINEITLKIVEYDLTKLDDIISFMKESNLIKLFLNVTNLVDYVYGVEVGIDTNGRKGRVSTSFKSTIEKSLFDRNIKYDKKVPEYIGNDKSLKILDFKFSINNTIYFIKSNFYNSLTGTKISGALKLSLFLNERLPEDVEFIWVADGPGMKSIAHDLNANWNKMKIMNLEMFKDFLK